MSESEQNHPHLNETVSAPQSEAFKTILDKMDATRNKLCNKMLVRMQGERTLANLHIESNSDEVRDAALAILDQINSNQHPTVLDQYASMGLTFLPQDSNQTHPRIQAQTELPNNPFPDDKPILALIHDEFDKGLRRKHKYMHASSARRIALFTYGSIEKEWKTKEAMLSDVLFTGRLPRPETVKIHETAHCSNAFGFDYNERTNGLVSNIKYEVLSLRHTVSGQKMYEVHSMLAEYILTGVSARVDLDVNSVQDVAIRAMIHPHVSGYNNRDRHINEHKITKMTNDLLEGNTKELPKWYLDEYEKTKEVLNNVLRVMTVEKTIGQTGTHLGRQKNKDKMMQYNDGTFPNWEKRIVKHAKRKGIIPKKMRLKEALQEIDKLTENKIDELNLGAQHVKFALQAGVVKSLAKEEKLSEVLGNTEHEVNDLIEKANQLSK